MFPTYWQYTILTLQAISQLDGKSISQDERSKSKIVHELERQKFQILIEKQKQIDDFNSDFKNNLKQTEQNNNFSDQIYLKIMSKRQQLRGHLWQEVYESVEADMNSDIEKLKEVPMEQKLDFKFQSDIIIKQFQEQTDELEMQQGQKQKSHQNNETNNTSVKNNLNQENINYNNVPSKFRQKLDLIEQHTKQCSQQTNELNKNDNKDQDIAVEQDNVNIPQHQSTENQKKLVKRTIIEEKCKLAQQDDQSKQQQISEKDQVIITESLHSIKESTQFQIKPISIKQNSFKITRFEKLKEKSKQINNTILLKTERSQSLSKIKVAQSITYPESTAMCLKTLRHINESQEEILQVCKTNRIQKQELKSQQTQQGKESITQQENIVLENSVSRINQKSTTFNVTDLKPTQIKKQEHTNLNYEQQQPDDFSDDEIPEIRTTNTNHNSRISNVLTAVKIKKQKCEMRRKEQLTDKGDITQNSEKIEKDMKNQQNTIIANSRNEQPSPDKIKYLKQKQSVLDKILNAKATSHQQQVQTQDNKTDQEEAKNNSNNNQNVANNINQLQFSIANEQKVDEEIQTNNENNEQKVEEKEQKIQKMEKENQNLRNKNEEIQIKLRNLMENVKDIKGIAQIQNFKIDTHQYELQLKNQVKNIANVLNNYNLVLLSLEQQNTILQSENKQLLQINTEFKQLQNELVFEIQKLQTKQQEQDKVIENLTEEAQSFEKCSKTNIDSQKENDNFVVNFESKIEKLQAIYGKLKLQYIIHFWYLKMQQITGNENKSKRILNVVNQQLKQFALFKLLNTAKLQTNFKIICNCHNNNYLSRAMYILIQRYKYLTFQNTKMQKFQNKRSSQIKQFSFTIMKQCIDKQATYVKTISNYQTKRNNKLKQSVMIIFLAVQEEVARKCEICVQIKQKCEQRKAFDMLRLKSYRLSDLKSKGEQFKLRTNQNALQNNFTFWKSLAITQIRIQKSNSFHKQKICKRVFNRLHQQVNHISHLQQLENTIIVQQSRQNNSKSIEMSIIFTKWLRFIRKIQQNYNRKTKQKVFKSITKLFNIKQIQQLETEKQDLIKQKTSVANSNEQFSLLQQNYQQTLQQLQVMKNEFLIASQNFQKERDLANQIKQELFKQIKENKDSQRQLQICSEELKKEQETKADDSSNFEKDQLIQQLKFENMQLQKSQQEQQMQVKKLQNEILNQKQTNQQVDMITNELMQKCQKQQFENYQIQQENENIKLNCVEQQEKINQKQYQVNNLIYDIQQNDQNYQTRIDKYKIENEQYQSEINKNIKNAVEIQDQNKYYKKKIDIYEQQLRSADYFQDRFLPKYKLPLNQSKIQQFEDVKVDNIQQWIPGYMNQIPAQNQIQIVKHNADEILLDDKIKALKQRLQKFQ